MVAPDPQKEMEIMEKIMQAGARQPQVREELEAAVADRNDELRTLTDLELRLAGGGDDFVAW
jgi:hypothetical protein